ncbi:hypothetical protein [Roseateles paludis]|jgi:hypothetical protein|uniref:CD-NTase-associated protein 12/Pycsar effector protein TIR domain-containing protein n=1 Tax=Roseateles paludis TaxID=3145238 RepID=A0ABV0FXR6_9BURK
MLRQREERKRIDDADLVSVALFVSCLRCADWQSHTRPLGALWRFTLDISIRKNLHCVIGLPRCDFVFSSTRSCFIAYGFEESTLEMSLLRKLLEERSIQPIEAGGSLTPGQNAYCAKICSKIIAAQFCIVLLNNSESGGQEIPSANVNMEYGLMLGFNKYVIPFQRSSQKLPFNVAGLDTIKYGNRDFERLASQAIDQAIAATTQREPTEVPIDQLLGAFLLAKGGLVASLADQGEKNLHDLGSPLGFSLLNDFSGTRVIYFGNFTNLRPEAVLWRLKTIESILSDRLASLEMRKQAGLINEEQSALVAHVLSDIRVWILVTSVEEATFVQAGLVSLNPTHSFAVYSLADVSSELAASGFGAG